jgi:peroxiredoxin (alkyl hydroperoxide reductase subunit C)
MVRIGDRIPDLTLQAFHQGEIKQLKLADFKGKWLVIAFYPADFTFVCPTELEELADHYQKFRELGAEVVSVSTDTAYVHKAWHDTSPAIKKIRFPMAADPAGVACRAFGTYLPAEGVSLRATFIVDPEGVLRAMEIHDNSIGRSAAEIIRKLQAAKYVSEHPGEVCPASWEPGKETLKPSLDLVGKL